MGLPNGSVVYAIVQDFLNKRHQPDGEVYRGKGKGVKKDEWERKVKASALKPSWSEERRARAMRIMIEKGTLGEAMAWIVERIRKEAAAEGGGKTPRKLDSLK